MCRRSFANWKIFLEFGDERVLLFSGSGVYKYSQHYENAIRQFLIACNESA
jgi:hypothetical protein